MSKEEKAGQPNDISLSSIGMQRDKSSIFFDEESSNDADIVVLRSSRCNLQVGAYNEESSRSFAKTKQRKDVILT